VIGETMTHTQINVRAPETARPVLLRIGGIIRKDPAFIDRLDAFISEADGEHVLELVAQFGRRLAVLEQERARG
jgi:hypothetical protein|tara:strand:+ start:828 stop:1049 length:222 start_codon:yes stop_codon:yes gene_type:complete